MAGAMNQKIRNIWNRIEKARRAHQSWNPGLHHRTIRLGPECERRSEIEKYATRSVGYNSTYVHKLNAKSLDEA
jgi:hypothetical protein